MRTATLIAIGCLAIMARANEDIVVRIRPANLSPGVLLPGEAEAARILRQVGVVVRWKLGVSSHERNLGASECARNAIDVSVIDILILDRTLETDHRGALGYALPFARSGVRIVIFYDRIAQLQRGPALLGHVIAHEIGHMLVGTLDHAGSGIMRANWNSGIVGRLAWQPLKFTPGDAAMIAQHFELQRRYCRAETEMVALSR